MKTYREFVAEAATKEPSPYASHEEHHAYHEKMFKKYDKHKNVSSASEQAQRARLAANHKKMMDYHAGKTGPAVAKGD
jgi:hypothetical protein